MRCHDFHLSGYDVRQSGDEVVLHLIYDYPPAPTEESHISHIEEVPVARILDQFWNQILNWASLHGGVPHWNRDDRSSYQAKLEAAGYKAWDIRSAIGFSGFVIAKSINDVTHE